MKSALGRALALAVSSWGALVATACGPAMMPPPPVPAVGAVHASGAAPGLHEGETVVAEVDRLERRAYEAWLDDGSVVVADTVGLGIVAPRRFDTMLIVHVKGHPEVDGRPLLLGDRVSFILPVNWRHRDLSLSELDQLAFAE